MDNNTSYETQAIDINLLSVLDITKDGKVVSAEKWVELWNLVFQHINKIDAFCVDMQSTLDNWHEAEIALNEIIEDMQIKYNALSTEFIHYGENPPENPHIMLWVRHRNDITPNYLLTNEDVDSELSSTSENPVQNKVANAALNNKMDKNNPTGTGSFSLNRRSGTVVGDYSHAEGSNGQATDTASHAEGMYTNALGSASHAEGNSTTASGGGSHAEGSSTQASGNNSHTEGFNTEALESNSHAEGMGTTASGVGSHAEGKSSNLFSNVVTATNPTNDDITTAWDNSKFSLAKGESAHVEGINSLALGSSSHAEGGGTQALGYASHAEGYITKASAQASHAEGEHTKASGYTSHTEGYHTKASSRYQHVQGKYNIEDTINNYADIIGNGKNDTERSNAYTLDWNGNAWYAGDVYVGSTSGTNKDDGSKKLATEEYINTKIGDIDTALDNIIALQNAYIGGNS